MLASAAVVIAAMAAAPSCQPNYTQTRCRDVPDGGCPLSNDQACNDPTCAAAYACNEDGTWTLDHVCPNYDGAAPVVIDAGDAEAATDFPHDANVDVPGAFGGPGCAVLQPPDCELGFALDCPHGCCDCENLFACQNGTWVPYGTCSEDGGIVITPEIRR